MWSGGGGLKKDLLIRDYAHEQDLGLGPRARADGFRQWNFGDVAWMMKEKERERQGASERASESEREHARGWRFGGSRRWCALFQLRGVFLFLDVPLVFEIPGYPCLNHNDSTAD